MLLLPTRLLWGRIGTAVNVAALSLTLNRIVPRDAIWATDPRLGSKGHWRASAQKGGTGAVVPTFLARNGPQNLEPLAADRGLPPARGKADAGNPATPDCCFGRHQQRQVRFPPVTPAILFVHRATRLNALNFQNGQSALVDLAYLASVTKHVADGAIVAIACNIQSLLVACRQNVLFLNDGAARLGKLVNPVELHSLVPGPNHANGSQYWQ